MEPVDAPPGRPVDPRIHDEALVARFLAGDRDWAFSLIMQRYRDRVYWTVRRLVVSHDDAEDVTQETFISAWKGLQNIRRETRLWAWLYRISLNAALGHLRKAKSARNVDWADEDLAVDGNSRSDTPLLEREREWVLRKAVSLLPPQQRRVFTLRYDGDLTYEEMARALGRSTGTLKANYHHATRKVERALRAYRQSG